MNNLRFLVLLGLFFAYLFFPLGVGLNIFAFDAGMLLALFATRPELAGRAGVRWAVFLLLASAVSVVVVHAPASRLVHHLSLLILMGFVQERELRFVWYGLFLGIVSLLAGPKRVYHGLIDRYGGFLSAPNRWVWVWPALTALVVSCPFLLLYTIGSSDFFRSLGMVTDWLIGLQGMNQVLLFLALFAVGMSITASLVLADSDVKLTTDEVSGNERLSRTRIGERRCSSMVALRFQYRRAIMVFATLNVLLFAVNLTDLRFIWMSAAELPATTLSEYVHTGTNSLILSIILAMALVLHFFRRNLNFYPHARTLRALTYLWLAQNAFLALSVGVRNGHYIHAYGLAIGRVYVGLALCLVLVGLFSLYRKVRQRMSIYYLLQVNGMAAWLFLVAFGAVNWSGIITRVNLRQPTDRIDWSYLVDDLDGTNHYMLRDQLNRLPTRYHRRVRLSREAVSDWRTWNYADWREENFGGGAQE
ncbi:DUF4173 domain-containing protein [Lewinella sp. IMCC34191]|uniref:DUF4153 domain-containing protein n=1 Tax=Lewinella sp. IMCC34191 TaxID=2259172 RepID=UPI000E2294C5|nr:DUF4173 domain-containing protein [Lewinella sp. IMCC34191]